MLFITLLFGIFGVVLIGAVESQPNLKKNPNVRIGADFFGAALVLIAISMFFTVV